jgi:transcriptional regulator of acetoin/glycerol metabolism
MSQTEGRGGDRAHEAHLILREQGAPPRGMLSEIIEASWQRCCTSGPGLDGQPNFVPLAAASLNEQIESNRLLVSNATPVMETLYEQIVNTQSMVILTDAQGLILHSVGDAEFVDRARRVALAPGIEWSEQNTGTNAIGTALIEQAPVVVHGPEHFLPANHMLTCSAAPVVDPMGIAVGVLDVSGDYRTRNPHTLALVRMSVQMIENHLFQSAFPEAVAVRFHARPEFLGTLCEGIAAFTPEGEFISANRSACYQLGSTLEALRRHSFASLFGMRFQLAQEQAALRPHVPLVLSMLTGVRVHALLSFGHRAPRPRSVFTFAHSAKETRQRSRQQPSVMSPGDSLDSLMTGDARVAAICTKLKRVIGRDIEILVQGETGTGKELLARAIHNEGPRHAAPFVAVNCASIPEGLIESELFGYEEGAFTGAKRKGSIGKVQQADGGTLFLDEIGDMPASLQARLLRVLQERRVSPLGSAKCQAVDISIISATNRNLRELVARGGFREDLYYRLNGLSVTLPPLRERTDLAELVSGILLREADQGRSSAVAPEVMDLFVRHPWPGNLRQLTNLLRTALAMAHADHEIRIEHLPDDFLDDLEVLRHDGDAVDAVRCEVPGAALSNDLQSIEMHAIRSTLEGCDGNISAASRKLGISRNTIYRRLKER